MARNAIDLSSWHALRAGDASPDRSANAHPALSFDLIGLPPPDEIDAFLEDRSPQAYERLVERRRLAITASAGQTLLDVARYGKPGLRGDHHASERVALSRLRHRQPNRDKP